MDRPGTVWFSQVSLQPPTWNDQPNGFRKDLMQMLVDLKPKFLRFPGGNFLEGDSIKNRWEWKKTLGPIEERAGHQGTWGYRASDGMGLLEFLHWCEAMNAEPVLGLFAGYTLNKDYIEAGPKLEPYVQDALEEIEYVIGDAKTTKWGAQRAKDGHPEPFKLNYVEVGNEDWFDKSNSYQGRYAQFHDAIKAKYPQLKIISSVGNEQPKELQVSSRTPDVVDEHYYRSADEFIKSGPTQYEQYSREKRPEIFVGEWAAHEDGKIRPWSREAKKQPPTPNMKVALGDAAFMASMERNADLIIMNCYAPLFINVNPGAWQWRPNLIGYDALTSYGSPSYHAIKMFSTNVGDQYLKLTHTDTDVQASATRDSKTGDLFIKLVNPTAKEVNLHLDLKGATNVADSAAVQTLAAEPNATNSIDHPTTVVPASTTFTGVKPGFDYPVPASSIVVLTVKAG
jgi:alpha-N-arabinofuranosidase